MIGKVFNRLTVIKYSHREWTHQYWWCDCSCGQRACIRASSLRSGKTKSCGCLQREVASKTLSKAVSESNRRRRLPDGVGIIRELVRRYKNNANKRKHCFRISEKNFIQLIRSPCFYCGLVPEQFKSYRKTPEAGINYNGLDRVNNKLGYTLRNVVPCCAQCNYAKRGQTQEAFLAWAKRITEYQTRPTASGKRIFMP